MIWRLPGRAARSSAPPAIDRARFEAEILPHLDSAANFARWKLRDATLAEDVVQEAMLRAFTYFPGFRGGDGRAWLLQIVRNVAVTALVGRTVASVSVDDDMVLEMPDPSDNPEQANSARQGRELLARALAALPDELRECLVLREFEELSYKEIAEVVGVPMGTVMSRLWRARQALLGSGLEGQENAV